MNKLLAGLLLALGCAAPIYAQPATLAPEPAGWPAVSMEDPILSGWQKVTEQALNNTELIRFARDPNYYSSDFAAYFQFYRDPLVSLLKSQTLTQQLYAWLKPGLLAKWKTMTWHEKMGMIEAIQHLKGYTATFSLAQEEAYAKAMSGYLLDSYRVGVSWNGQLQGDYFFTRYRPQDMGTNYQKPSAFYFPYRRLETFVYRRVKGGVPVAHLQWLMNALAKDFTAPVSQAVNAEYPELSLKETGTIRNAKREGVWKLYQKNEQGQYILTDSSTWLNGKRHGKRVLRGTYDPESYTVEMYENGLQQEYIYYSAWKGKVSSVSSINNKKRVRTYTAYHDDGKIREEEVVPFDKAK